MAEFLDRRAAEQIANLRERLLFRELRREEKGLRNFCSNDYLGLASHPALKDAAQEAVEKYGAGCGAARLVSGNIRLWDKLEERLTAFKQTESALVFSNGFATALGAIPALAGREDVIILDKLCHASLVDGARLSGAELRIYPHNDLEKLESHLKWAVTKRPGAGVFVVTESVFSMDGDVAPLREIVEIKERYGAALFVDEAHATGVLGPGGRGLAAELGVQDRVEIQMGTLGKALGCAGGYICGKRALIDLLVNRARSFIFSTAAPPAQIGAAIAAVDIVTSSEGDALRARLWENIRSFAGAGAQSAICPVILGEESAALEASRKLREKGFLVPAIRYPTVARGKARLRVTLSASHSAEEVDMLRKALEESL